MTFRDLIESVFEVYESSQDDEVWVDCPFCMGRGHSEDTKHRLGINLQSGFAHCFQCDYKRGQDTPHRKLRVFVDICEVFNLDERMDDVELTEEELEERKKLKKAKQLSVALPREFEPLWKSVNDPIGRAALHYLEARGVTHEQIKKYRIGFCGAGKYSWRIIFPVFTRKKKLAGLVCRTFAKEVEPKYLNSEGSKTLYGVRRKRRSTVVLLEGCIDKLAVERAIKKRDSLGRLGSSLTEAQLKILKKYKEVIVWPDPDEPGIAGMIKSVKSMRDAGIKHISVVPPLKDAAYDQDPGKIGETEEGLKEIRSRVSCKMKWSRDIEELCLARVLFMR